MRADLSPPRASVRQLVRAFLPYGRGIWWRTAVVVSLILTSPVIGIALLWLMKLLLDDVFVGGSVTHLPAFLVAYSILVASQIMLRYQLTRIDAAITEQISLDVRVALYRHLISASPGSFHRLSEGDLLSHLSGDVGYVEYLIYSGPLALVSNVVSTLAYAIFLVAISWTLTLAALISIPSLVWLSYSISPHVRRSADITRRKVTAWFSLAQERLGIVPLIYAYDVQENQTAIFKTRASAARSAELRSVKIQARLTLLLEVAAATGGLLVLAIAGYERYHGGLTIGALVAFLGSVGSLYSPVRSLANAPGRFQRASAGSQRVYNLFQTKSLIQEKPACQALKNVQGALEFQDVHFGYEGGPDVIRGVSLRIEPGEMVALVGPNGSGKSTLLALGARFYDPSKGAVLIDGVNIADLPLGSLHQHVSIVLQNPDLVRGSIRDNISFSVPAAGESEIVGAGKDAHVDEFANKHRAGYLRPVGPHGEWLSGGQRQRVALARAFLHSAPILLLDEATAAVDGETEELIQDALTAVAGKRTVLLVGHRHSLVRRADRVVVLENGRIVEVGSPGFLLSSNSRFRQFFAPQIRSGDL